MLNGRIVNLVFRVRRIPDETGELGLIQELAEVL